MSNEIVIEKFYDKLEDFKRECPNCGNTLQFGDDDGNWNCENIDSKEEPCNYLESNNITECHGEGCGNLVLSKEYDVVPSIAYYFINLEDQFCQIPHRDDTTCLGIAQGESNRMEHEDYEIRQQMNGHPRYCDCFLCIHY